jgi:hypothetical protein
MNDSTFAYPEFKEGQVLTHNDLNLLRDYLYTKSMFHGRALFGFGAACGLDGRIDGTNLRIGTGFALAQGGRELRVTAERSFGLTGTPTTDPTAYAFVDPGPGGYTPILRPADTIEAPGGDCDETGCTTHTEIHHEEAVVVLVPGRLRLDPILAQPAVEAIFALSPIDPKTNPTFTGFAAQRDALRTALTPYLETATLDYLLPSKLKLEGPPGVDLRKVGLVNEILYTAWDFFLCRVASGAPCGGVAAPPVAVALGWLQKPGATWIWDARYRHYFQLSLALYRAIRGHRGQDLCRAYLDHIRVLLESFEVPVIPPSTGGTNPPPVEVCPPGKVIVGLCPGWPKKPPKELPYKVELIDPTKFGPKGPIPIGPDDYLPVALGDSMGPLVYPTVDPADSGLIYITQLLGTKAGPAADKVRDAIEDVNLDAKVSVVTLEEFKNVPGLVPGLAVAASDDIYLGRNDAGAVVATGSVPTSHHLGQVSDIAVKAENAEQIAKGIEGRVGTVENGFVAFKEDLEEDFGEFKTGLQNEFDVFKNSLPLNEIAKATALGEKVTNVQIALETTNGKITAQGATITQLDTRTKTLELRGLPTGAGAGARGGAVVNTSLYEALDAMSEAIKAGSTQRAGPKVRRALASVDAQFEVLRREAVSEELIMAAHPEAVSDVVDGIVEAVAAMGLTAESPEFRKLTENVAVLKGAMGVG